MNPRLGVLLCALIGAPLPALAKAHPGVILQISVKGARVAADGELRTSDAGQEVTLVLAPGMHTIRVEHDGFLPWEQKLEVGRGRPSTVAVMLQLSPPKAVEASPPPKPAPPVVVAPAPAPPAPRVARPIRVGVYEVRASAAVDARMTAVLSEAMLAEVRKLDHISAIGMEEIGEMLSFEQKRQLLGCDEDACLTEIAGAMGVDELVTATISTLGDSRLFTIRRIDMIHASVKGTVTKRLVAGNGEEMLATIGPAIAELYPEYPLREGRVRGVSKAVAARLNPPPLPRAVAITTGSAALVSALVGSYFAVRFSNFQSQHDSLAQSSATQVVSASEVTSAGRQAVLNAQHANVSFAVAGGLALTAGVMSLFTDWHGYASAAAVHGTTVAVGLAPTGLLVSWGP